MFAFLDISVIFFFIVVIVYLCSRLLFFRKRTSTAEYFVHAYEQILDHSSDIIWLKDKELRLEFVNKAYRSLYPNIENFKGLTDEDFADKFLADGYRRDDEFVIKSGKDYRYQENDKGVSWFETVKLPIFDGNGSVAGCGGIAHNITDRKNEELKNYELEHIDFLTGISNRHSVISSYPEKLAIALSKNLETALFSINIADFRLFNVIHGFINGDAVLREISFRLRVFCQGYKSHLCRVGGDTFSIFIEDVHNADDIADKLEKLVNEPVNIGGEEVRFNSSIAVVLAPRDTSNFEDMCRKSELCIRYNRIKGVHKITTYCSISSELFYSDPLIEMELSNAIKNDELIVLYQPKINSDTQKSIGAEALIRWRNKRIGDLNPRQFIPIAEDNGSILNIGYWVIEKCITQNLEWGACGYDMKPISINLTKKQFSDPKLIKVVSELLTKYNYPASLIEFETSETSFNDNSGLANDIVSKLHALGIKVCIDDFGVSFANMVSVTSLSVDGIKLDPRFVQGIDSSVGKQEIVRTIYDLCKKFGLHVIAEGVETKNELIKVSGIGINSIQGFYYAKPMNPQEYEKFISDGK